MFVLVKILEKSNFGKFSYSQVRTVGLSITVITLLTNIVWEFAFHISHPILHDNVSLLSLFPADNENAK